MIFFFVYLDCESHVVDNGEHFFSYEVVNADDVGLTDTKFV